MEPHPASTSERHAMVQAQLRSRGITDERVLAAINAVPREAFVPSPLREHAYADRALAIGAGQTISQPYIVAYMSEQLRLLPTHRVLEIGTGSGYQAAILAQLCAEVRTIEAVHELATRARARLRSMTNIHCTVGDGTQGWPDAAPFDRIMITAGTPTIPQPLVDQLATGGRMILPLGNLEQQRLILVDKRPDRIIEIPLIGCRFVKLIGTFGWPS